MRGILDKLWLGTTSPTGASGGKEVNATRHSKWGRNVVWSWRGGYHYCRILFRAKIMKFNPTRALDPYERWTDPLDVHKFHNCNSSWRSSLWQLICLLFHPFLGEAMGSSSSPICRKPTRFTCTERISAVPSPCNSKKKFKTKNNTGDCYSTGKNFRSKQLPNVATHYNFKARRNHNS